MVELDPSSLPRKEDWMGEDQAEAQADRASAQKEGLSWNYSASRWRNAEA